MSQVPHGTFSGTYVCGKNILISDPLLEANHSMYGMFWSVYVKVFLKADFLHLKQGFPVIPTGVSL